MTFVIIIINKIYHFDQAYLFNLGREDRVPPENSFFKQTDYQLNNLGQRTFDSSIQNVSSHFN